MIDIQITSLDVEPTFGVLGLRSNGLVGLFLRVMKGDSSEIFFETPIHENGVRPKPGEKNNIFV